MKLSRLSHFPGPLKWLLVAAVGAGFVSCGDGGNGNGVATDPVQSGLSSTTLTATLTADQEVPPVTTGAVGTGTLRLETPTRNVSGSITLDGMTATAAHVHTGESGVNGPVIVTLAETSPGTWSVPAGATLTEAQATAFNAGGLYFNAHSTANPNGEIRGQIGREVFVSQLSPAQEVPPPASTASGVGRLTVDPATRRINATLNVTGLVASVAHIHSGAAGVNGPILFPLTETAAGSGVWATAADATMTEAQLALLRAGGLYFNAHSTAFPAGEIRGQIAREVRFASLTGGEEVPPTPSLATGTGTLVVDTATRAASGGITIAGMTATMAHVHQAPVGTNGPIIIPLDNGGGGVWSVPSGSRLTADQYLAYKQGNLYYNAHSTDFPGGEVRGQLR